jgi:hypothetical protein
VSSESSTVNNARGVPRFTGVKADRCGVSSARRSCFAWKIAGRASRGLAYRRLPSRGRDVDSAITVMAERCENRAGVDAFLRAKSSLSRARACQTI